MKKIWSYIAVFFAGVSVMAIAALKWFAGDDINVTYKRIKSKRNKGQSDINLPLTVDSPENKLKSRQDRKIDRIHSRVERRKRKALKRL